MAALCAPNVKVESSISPRPQGIYNFILFDVSIGIFCLNGLRYGFTDYASASTIRSQKKHVERLDRHSKTKVNALS